MSKYYIKEDLANPLSNDHDIITAAERLENGSIKFHENIVIPCTLKSTDREKERNKILQEIAQKYKD